MAKETSEAAILQLRAKALEVYGIIKDTLAKPAEDGDADKIAVQALKLAQFEGGMLTLQQYFTSATADAPPTPPPMVVTEEVSPTLRRTNAVKKGARTKTKKAEESE